jgi:cytochrome c oxidase cbb3-type subunit 3
LFYGTIVIAILYLLNYHVFKISPLSAEEYNDEVKVANMQREELIRTGAFINENTVKFTKEDAVLTEGKNIFNTNCTACHGPQGGGLIGPNLTDDYWIHGGGIVNVFKTIKYGVPVKGMISWQNQLNPKQMQAVANYVLSLKGSNPPNGKQPEGQVYTDSLTVKTDSTKVDSTIKK